MIIKHREQRVGVFIDIQNLYHSAKNLYGKRVNFKNLLDFPNPFPLRCARIKPVVLFKAGSPRRTFHARLICT